MELRQLRELIEHDRVAMLRFKPVNSIHYVHEVRIKKFEEWYIHQLKIFLLNGQEENDRQISEHTDLLEWSEVRKQLGRQASSSDDWVIVDEEIDDPFPPERRTAP